ncbi:hypothetical protein F4779DRAFT_640637 [Xylariaceae sp. FL0662B]|nr:hypothetical protein F4779DRAFT_640637 [Xylariaceae sp. FL0662B]
MSKTLNRLSAAWTIFQIVFVVYFLYENYEPFHRFMIRGHVPGLVSHSGSLLYSEIGNFSDTALPSKNIPLPSENIPLPSEYIPLPFSNLSLPFLDPSLPFLDPSPPFSDPSPPPVDPPQLSVNLSLFSADLPKPSSNLFLLPENLTRFVSNLSHHVPDVPTATTTAKASIKTIGTYLLNWLWYVPLSFLRDNLPSSDFASSFAGYVSRLSSFIRDNLPSADFASSLAGYVSRLSSFIRDNLPSSDFASSFAGYISRFLSFIRASAWPTLISWLRYPPVFVFVAGLVFYNGYGALALYTQIMHGTRSRVSLQLLWMSIVSPALVVGALANALPYFEASETATAGPAWWLLSRAALALTAYLLFEIIRANVALTIGAYTAFDVVEHEGTADSRRVVLPWLLYRAARIVFELTATKVPFYREGNRMRGPVEYEVRTYDAKLPTTLTRLGIRPDTVEWVRSRAWLP